MRRKSNGWVYARKGRRYWSEKQKPEKGATWFIGYYADGKKVREAAGLRKSDATGLLHQRIGELNDGKWQHPAQPLTFDDLLALLKADYQAQERKSWSRVETSVKHLRNEFGHCQDAKTITALRLTNYSITRQKAGAAVSTVRNELNVLKRAMNLAVRNGLLPARPPFPTLTPKTVRTGFFERHELDTLLKELPDWVQPVATFLYLTGWRRGEVLSRQWQHVDFRAGVIRLEPGQTKNDEGRTFPFDVLPELGKLLRAQRTYTEEVQQRTGQVVPFVFHREGRPIKSFRTAWRAACKRVALKALAAREGKTTKAVWKEMTREERRDLKGFSRIPHDFRRTVVRNLERAGVSRSVAMKLTGHKTESIYRRYAIVNEQDLREGVAKLAAAAPDRQVLPLAAATGHRARFGG